MTSLYPRLALRDAVERLDELRRASERGSTLSEFASAHHPRAFFAPTGGSVCSDNELWTLRAEVLSSLVDSRQGAGRGGSGTAQVDLAIGRALGTRMDINPGDAGHNSVWSFLTLVVLPDVAYSRFSDLHEKRMLGGARNTFQRLWHRERVVGDLMADAPNPLGEDEMVGIFERSELARNRSLARAMARTVLAAGGTNRSEFARQFYKRVRFHTGPYALDLHTEDELVVLCRELAQSAS